MGNQIIYDGQLTWTVTVATLGAGSTQLVAANANRRKLIISNPTNGATASVRLDGGTATAVNGIPLAIADSIMIDNPPTGAITALGTDTKTLVVHEGSRSF